MITSVIVHRGSEFPGYLSDFITQFFLFNRGRPLWIVVDHPFPELDGVARQYEDFRILLSSEIPPTRHHVFFSRWNRMNSTFRGGFWRFAVERFFLLEDVMQEYGLNEALHFEYDNMVYFDVGTLESSFRKVTTGVSLPADAVDRCIPSVVFIADPSALADFCHTYNSRYLLRKMNDMRAFSHYSHKANGRCSLLPVLPSWYKDGKTELKSVSGHGTRDTGYLDQGFEVFGGVFDAAAFGQYAGGVDPRNDAALGPGFVNETALYSPADFSLTWERDGGNRLIPLLSYQQRTFPLFNLHVHSKNLSAFRSDRERQ